MSTPSPEATRKSSSPSLTKSASKTAKPSKITRLKLSSYLLTQFPYEDSDPTPIKPKSSQPAKSGNKRTPKASAKDKDDNSNATSDPTAVMNGEGESGLSKDDKRKGMPGPKPGSKRSAPPAEPDSNGKPKGKPGPKKRKGEPENGAPAPAPAPKLGPKANQGAINAQLRALDLTGKPCRRWGKRTVTLKSFTGINWDLPYWQSPRVRRHDLSNDAQSEDTSSSDAKNEFTSSQVASESNGGNQPSITLNGTPDLNGTMSFTPAPKPTSSDNAPDAPETAGQQAVEVTSVD